MAEKIFGKVVEFSDLVGMGLGAICGWSGGIIGALAGSVGGYFLSRELAKKTHTHSSPAKYQTLSRTKLGSIKTVEGKYRKI